MLKRVLNAIVLWWTAEKRARVEFEQELLRAETLGCRNSAERLDLNCRAIWERFGWWSWVTSTMVARLHNKMYAALGDRDRAAMVSIGVVALAVRIGEDPTIFVPRFCELLVGLAAHGLGRRISAADYKQLAKHVPGIGYVLDTQNLGLPTTARLLQWISHR